MMRPKAKPRPDRSDEFASFVVDRPRAVMAGRLDGPRVAVLQRAPQKTPGRVQQSIRDSARGEACLMRLPGCRSDPEMTIWSHNRHHFAGKGGAIKAIDQNGCYACTRCDEIYDGSADCPGLTRENIELAWYRAHSESLVILKRKGLI